MSETYSRRIELHGAVNFRDIGGYPAAAGRRVRWRRVFRSDSLDNLTAADRAQFAAIGVRALVDFRIPAERLARPNQSALAAGMRTYEIGFLPAGTIDMLRAVSRGTVGAAQLEAAFIDQYRRFVTQHSAEFSRALAYALEAENLPLLVHCTSGKDRTGFAISALLLALGTPQATILEDYTLTNSYMRDITNLFGAGAPPELVRLVMTAQPKYLEAAFEQITRSYGSIDAYLVQALGLDDAKRARLVEGLTESS